MQIDVPPSEWTPQSKWYEPLSVEPMVVTQEDIDGGGALPIPGQMFVMIGLALVAFALLMTAISYVTASNWLSDTNVEAAESSGAEVGAVGAVSNRADGRRISPVFSAEIQHWNDKIIGWADGQGLDPNFVATIMQIESCGNPNALSHAGAQGLFQVMPFHFAAGEVMLDPDTNAMRGTAYMAEGMTYSGGDVGRTFAGYNGGHGTAARNWESWPHETQRYYIWSTGIYQDIANGLEHSATLDEWMAAGGSSLCSDARMVLGLN